MSKIDYNGKVFPADAAVIQGSDKSYRYGDGLFETMHIYKGQVLLEDLHFDRLFSSLERLGIKLPKLLDRAKILSSVITICEMNNALQHARVRLSFSSGAGGLLESGSETKYLLEAWPLEQSIREWNTNGLELGIYTAAKKSCDAFSSIKTSSFLPYVQAARFGKQNKWNDCLVLNSFGRICDSAIANVFLVKGGKLVTPSLDEGCIDGVMRRFIIERTADHGLIVEEKDVTIEELEDADEVFLTNAIRGIRWVKAIASRNYGNDTAKKLHGVISQLLFK